jgi:signal transduction histidine kinase
MMEEKLIKAERFAAIGELAGMIAHDLRNPLTSTQGAAYFLRKKYSEQMDESGKNMISTIERSVDFSNRIVNDLLDYSREIKLELKDASPKKMVDDALSVLTLPEGITVSNSVSDSPDLPVDCGKMSRVFMNVFKNAFDAMPNGGELTLMSKETERFVEVCIKDTGVGMSPETLNQIWTPLFTTKAKGMGFGLSICKRIVKAHGGEITAKSVLGEGTTITVSLPLKTQQAASPEGDKIV